MDSCSPIERSLRRPWRPREIAAGASAAGCAHRRRRRARSPPAAAAARRRLRRRGRCAARSAARPRPRRCGSQVMLQLVIEARRGAVVDLQAHHREQDARARAPAACCEWPSDAQPLGARALEEAQVVGVVDDAAAVGVFPVDACRPGERAHRASSNSCRLAPRARAASGRSAGRRRASPCGRARCAPGSPAGSGTAR